MNPLLDFLSLVLDATLEIDGVYIPLLEDLAMLMML